MLIEAEAIPYEPALLRGERLLVLAPHPDDEVIGCGGLVAQHLREQRAVRIVVATDGAQAGEAAVREAESRRALALLGPAEMEFLGFPDRSLGDDASKRIQEEIAAFRPDLILVPSPIEIHPDHLALARIFCELVQSDAQLQLDLPLTHVAFYEVGQPLRPNALVDISDVAAAKYAAIAEHATQLAVRDYVAYARGLNAYRAMTLPAGTQFAEAYFVVALSALRTTAFSELRSQAGAPPQIESRGEVLPVSVVIRTKNRPALLREAIESVRATGYPCQIVVVNDGGALPDLEPDANTIIVHHESSRGRSEAANSGVASASHAFLAFLDDDDLFYPEHLDQLAGAARLSHAAWYTDAVSTFLRPGEEGTYVTQSRQRIYSQDFDPDLLLIDNYIPLPTLLVRREMVLEAGGFDPQFDLFEDWDLLIRLAERGSFLHIPRVTCEIRHYEGGTSAILAAPEGSEAFRSAKLRVWQKHGIGADLFVRAFEKHKRRVSDLQSQVVETSGQAAHARLDVDRLQREKQAVIDQNAETQNTINAYAMRTRELEGSIQALNPIVADLERKLLHAKLEGELLTRELERRSGETSELRRANAASHAELERLRVEIQRLNGLLEMIYRSKTWKLHTTLERIRGRG